MTLTSPAALILAPSAGVSAAAADTLRVRQRTIQIACLLNRAAAYAKLSAFNRAVEDCTVCVTLMTLTHTASTHILTVRTYSPYAHTHHTHIRTYAHNIYVRTALTHAFPDSHTGAHQHMHTHPCRHTHTHTPSFKRSQCLNRYGDMIIIHTYTHTRTHTHTQIHMHILTRMYLTRSHQRLSLRESTVRHALTLLMH